MEKRTEQLKNCLIQYEKESGPLLRKDAARIIHEFLRDELKEPEESDASPAYRLQDLFDCRVCAGHVIQVYVKGIMEGYFTREGRFIFGMQDKVLAEELERIVERAIKSEYRKKCSEAGQSNKLPQEISFEEAQAICRTEKEVTLIDVRTAREYGEYHLKDAVNIPVMSVLKNPYMVCERRDSILLLYCNEGYQSQGAARCLSEAGYEKVYYFAWKKE